MEIFSKTCIGSEYKENEFFQEWHKAIIKDFLRFKIILEKYPNSIEKENLLRVIEYITNNIKNEYDEDDEIIMRNTTHFFLFSFFTENDDLPNYVLLSKDYKKILLASEIMECFDDPDYNEEERYGIYAYDYFYTENGMIEHIHNEKKEYTQDYTNEFTRNFYGEEEKSNKNYQMILRKII